MNHDYQYNGRYTSSTRDRSSGGVMGSPLPFALALIGGGAVIFGLWYYFYAGDHKTTNQPIPVIKAEQGPMKVKPDNASQPEVPHQDKLVYSRVNPAEQTKGVERLLPPTEEPVDMAPSSNEAAPTSDEGFPNPSLKAENPSQFRVEPMTATPAPTESNPAPIETKTKQDNEVERLPGTLARDEHETAQEVDVKPAVTAQSAPVESPKVAGPKALQSGYRIQLASMKSQELAKGEWKRLQTEYKGVLSGLSPTYSRVDLGAKKGIYYRVQAGDFSSKTEAQNACSKLKAQNSNAGCIIVKF